MRLCPLVTSEATTKSHQPDRMKFAHCLGDLLFCHNSIARYQSGMFKGPFPLLSDQHFLNDAICVSLQKKVLTSLREKLHMKEFPKHLDESEHWKLNHL